MIVLSARAAARTGRQRQSPGESSVHSSSLAVCLYYSRHHHHHDHLNPLVAICLLCDRTCALAVRAFAPLSAVSSVTTSCQIATFTRTVPAFTMSAASRKCKRKRIEDRNSRFNFDWTKRVRTGASRTCTRKMVQVRADLSSTACYFARALIQRESAYVQSRT